MPGEPNGPGPIAAPHFCELAFGLLLQRFPNPGSAGRAFLPLGRAFLQRHDAMMQESPRQSRTFGALERRCHQQRRHFCDDFSKASLGATPVIAISATSRQVRTFRVADCEITFRPNWQPATFKASKLWPRRYPSKEIDKGIRGARSYVNQGGI